MRILFLFFLLFVSPFVLAQDPGGEDRDPVARINYINAFELSRIQKKYEQVLLKFGCPKDIFDDGGDVNESPICKGGYVALPLQDFLDGEDDGDLEPLLKQYQEECIKNLNSERRAILLRPAKESLIMISLMGAASGGILMLAGADSFGGSFSIFASMFNSVFYLRDLIRSGYNTCFTPPHAVDAFEIQYVKNQCFIPKAIWPKLLQKFMMARSNPFAQQDALNFIEFTLGLTIFKPAKPLPDINLKESRKLLAKKIDAFFADYENVDEQTKHLFKVNAKRFLKQLCGNRTSPRYLYLVGEGGIGKTHFARELVLWIEEVLKDALHLEEIKITNPEELEGSPTYPGAFLRVLRNQCQAEKIGTIIFIDEANWLNEKPFEAASKRVFNGNQSKVATSYFGSGQDGSGIQLPMPPTLIIVAANNTIEDDALRSRFDCVEFPKPSKAALQKHAVSLVLNSEDARDIDGVIDNETLQDPFLSELYEKIQDAINFRQIQSIVPTIINDWEEKAY